MNRTWTMLLCALLPLTAGAAEGVLSADAKLGKPLHEKSCVACHAEKFGGDASKIYTRADRLIKDKGGLVQRVAACNANFKLGLSPRDEAHVAAYLNEQYYKFK